MYCRPLRKKEIGFCFAILKACSSHRTCTPPRLYITIKKRRLTAKVHDSWCVRIVPHGGYVTSCFLSVAKLHFSTVRSSYNLPHTIALQLNFLRRIHFGSATFTVSELKLGRRTSAIHIALSQDDLNPPSVVG